jgi:hypothetical protein
LIVDEVGLLLTFGDYWTSLTYSFFIVFLAFIAVLVLFYRYRRLVEAELAEFVKSRISLYFGVLLAAVSIAFILQTNNVWIATISTGLTVAAIIIIAVFLAWQIRKKASRTPNYAVWGEIVVRSPGFEPGIIGFEV